MTSTELLRTDHLTRHFNIGGALSRRTLHAVDDVSLTIGEREIVALAGESGSGKSTIARLLARIYSARPAGRSTSRASRSRGSARAATACATAAWCRWCSRTRSARSTRCSGSQHGVLRSLKLHRP